jgi:ABC-type transporter Mla MlaB component
VAIPFFRKGKDQEPGANQRRSNSTRTFETIEGVTRIEVLSPDALKNAIVIEEAGVSESNSAIDEAAILYANGQLDETELTLKNMLDSDDPRVWTMLFDLYHVMGRNKDFEQLALAYTVKFEASPPMWHGGAETDGIDEEHVGVTLPQSLDQSAAAMLEKAVQSADPTAPLQLDFSQTSRIESDGAERIASTLNQVIRSQRDLQVSGISNLIRTLQEQIEAGTNQTGAWMLLLALYQLLGRQEEFEDLAVNYAVHFEVSPPSWETVKAAMEVAAPQPRAARDGNACQWTGIISGEQPRAYSDLIIFAQNHNPVVVDLTEVSRIEYGSVSSLISTLMGILGNGKSIIMKGHNSLIHALLCSLGIQHMVELKPAALS